MSSKKVDFVNRREALNLTQRQIAEAADVTPRAVQAWEAGDYYPRLTLLQAFRLCERMGCSIGDLAKDFHPEAFLDAQGDRPQK